jgi:hypothetical protein
MPELAFDPCTICGGDKHPLALACKRCKHILDRVETRRDDAGALRRVDKAARLRALRESWRDGAFHCFYTDVELITDRERSHDRRYLHFEHRTPGDESSVVVTSALVNLMKTNLSEEEFRTMVAELARAFAGERFDDGAFPDGAVP